MTSRLAALLPYLVLAILIAVVSYAYFTPPGLLAYTLPREELLLLLDRVVLVTTICCWAYWGVFVFRLLKFAPDTTESVTLKRPAGINAAIVSAVLFLVFPATVMCVIPVWRILELHGTTDLPLIIIIILLSIAIPPLLLVLFCIRGILIKGSRLCAALICLPSLFYVTLPLTDFSLVLNLLLHGDRLQPKLAMTVLLISAALIYFLNRRDGLLYMQGKRIEAARDWVTDVEKPRMAGFSRVRDAMGALRTSRLGIGSVHVDSPEQ